MKVNLAFSQTSDERFLVLAEDASTNSSEWPKGFALTTYDNENIFLRCIVEAELEEPDATELMKTVLLSVAQPEFPPRWVEIDLSQEQSDTLGLNEGDWDEESAERLSNTAALEEFFGSWDAKQFYQMMLHAQTPFVVLHGPEHRFAFANSSYLEMMGCTEEIIGKSVVEAFPELADQVFPRLLGNVYRTGVPYVGREVFARMQDAHSVEAKEVYFDFNYHPLIGDDGKVSGIMAHVSDVTGKVLARQVSEARERQLYSQWSELEAIYGTSPVGMALFDGKDFRILRINRRQAELMGSSIDELIGKRLPDLQLNIPDFPVLVKAVAAGKSIRNTTIQEEISSSQKTRLTWLVNISPALGASGEVTAISSVFLELPGEVWAGSGLAISNNMVSDVLENTTDGIYVLDRSWCIVYINGVARKVMPNAQELLGQNIWEAFPDLMDLPYWSHLHRVMERRAPESFEMYFPEPACVWFEVNAFAAKDGLSVFFRNITERKLEEAALRESEERYRMLLDNTPRYRGS
jgi:PAS domain-containing protein